MVKLRRIKYRLVSTKAKLSPFCSAGYSLSTNIDMTGHQKTADHRLGVIRRSENSDKLAHINWRLEHLSSSSLIP